MLLEMLPNNGFAVYLMLAVWSMFVDCRELLELSRLNAKPLLGMLAINGLF